MEEIKNYIQKIRDELSSNEQKWEAKNELIDEMFEEFYKSGEEDFPQIFKSGEEDFPQI